MLTGCEQINSEKTHQSNNTQTKQYMSGSVNGIEEGSVFPSENVTIQYN